MADRHVERRRFWHGGVPGFQIGHDIVPRAELPQDHVEHILSTRNDPTDPGCVYVTELKRLGNAFAIRYGLSRPDPYPRVGALYEVEPIGELEPDEDFPPSARCWKVRRARVIAVSDAHVQGSEKIFNRESGRYSRWTDDTPIYSPQGYLLPWPELRAMGVTAQDMVHLGRWVSYQRVKFNTATRKFMIGDL
ncbi:hypothetical protein [Nocardia altamirensis]|uniref:hypothetical protein n=1 Tax=Nocardia altamirensis TaxID=472158 RepID=UPI00084070EB|nr:hypothetical protein [Nocardia altamirensis]